MQARIIQKLKHESQIYTHIVDYITSDGWRLSTRGYTERGYWINIRSYRVVITYIETRHRMVSIWLNIYYHSSCPNPFALMRGKVNGRQLQNPNALRRMLTPRIFEGKARVLNVIPGDRRYQIEFDVRGWRYTTSSSRRSVPNSSGWNTIYSAGCSLEQE